MSQFYQKDDVNRRPITIVEDRDSFYKLSDGQMIKKDVFPKYYMPFMNESAIPKFSSDHIDPESFFNTNHVIPVEKLKTVDTSRMTERDDMAGATIVKNTTNQVKTSNPVQQSQQMNESLVRQAPIDQPIPNHTNTDVSQYKVYDNDEDAYADFVKRSQNPNQQPTQQPVQQPTHQNMMSEIEVLFEDEKLTFGEEEAIKRRDKRLKRTPMVDQSNYNQTSGPIYQPTQQHVDDPSEIMFKTFKRNHEISINMTFKDKIGKPDFVKMMIENMEGDIIQYYKKVIMGNIMKNIKHIEDEVEKNLRSEIFGEEGEEDVVKVKKTTKPKKPSRVIPTVPKEERSQINEGTDDKEQPKKIKRERKSTSSKKQKIDGENINEKDAS